MAENLLNQNKAGSKRQITLPAIVWAESLILGLSIGLLLDLLTIRLIRGDLSSNSPKFRGVGLQRPYHVFISP